MNIANATPATREVALRRRAAEAVGAAMAAWRGLTAKRWLAATVVALLFLLPYSASSFWPPAFDRFRPGGAASLLITAWITLLGLAIAERFDRGTTLQPWRYLPLGIAASIAGPLLTAFVFEAAAAAILWAGAGKPAGWPAFHDGRILGAIFESLVIVNGSLFIYVFMRNSARLARMANEAEVRGAEIRRRVVASELAAAQALVEPGFLLGTLDRIERLYEDRGAAGERLMDALIGYLRAALPLLDDERSALGDQLALAGAYLRIEQSRLGSDRVADLDVAPQLRQLRLPPFLMPLVRWVVEHRIALSPGSGRMHISAGLADGRLTVELADDLPGATIGESGDDDLTELRPLLAALFGERTRLSLERNDSGGMTLRLEAPHAG